MQKTISDYELYLYFSYLPRFAKADLQWLKCDFDNDFGRGVDDEAWWVQEGVKALKETIASQVASTDKNASHIVLLSGGLDSRAILGGVLDNVPRTQIIAATYGIPGAWDYEIAKIITRKLGIRHEVFNLLDERWDIDQLVLAATRLKHPVSVYQSYIRQKINNHFGEGCVYWSGFFGDAIGGWDFPRIPSTDKLEAIKRFINIEPTPHYKDQAFRSELINKIYVEFPWAFLHQPKFSFDQLLIYCLKEKFLLQPIVIINGFNFMIPFLSQRWVNFMSNVPYKWLPGQYLYQRIIQESYEKLSKLPAQAGAGAPFYASKQEIFIRKAFAKVKPYVIRRDPYFSHPRTNYINWKESLRHKSFLQDSVYTTLQDLKKRAIFDNGEIDAWWQAHLGRKADYTILLMNLSSLELLLKAGVM